MAFCHVLSVFIGFPRKLKLYLKFCLSLSVMVLIIFLIPTPQKHFTDPQMFSGFNNETGLDYEIIPNIVHYVIFNNQTIDFVLFASITSVIKFQSPNLILIHTNMAMFSGYYWQLIQSLLSVSNTTLKFNHISVPTHVYGQRLSSIYHASDITRINVLMQYGGIYLDTDSLVLKNLRKFLHYEMVLGWPEGEDIGSQILIAHKNARFLRLWLNGYRIYKSTIWYFNAGQYPSEQILQKRPDLIHRVKNKFGVDNVLIKLHEEHGWSDWKEYFTIHLLARHYPGVENINEVSIMSSNTSCAEIYKYILYGTPPYFDIHNVVLKENPHHWVYRLE